MGCFTKLSARNHVWCRRAYDASTKSRQFHQYSLDFRSSFLNTINKMLWLRLSQVISDMGKYITWYSTSKRHFDGGVEVALRLLPTPTLLIGNPDFGDDPDRNPDLKSGFPTTPTLPIGNPDFGDDRDRDPDFGDGPESGPSPKSGFLLALASFSGKSEIPRFCGVSQVAIHPQGRPSRLLTTKGRTRLHTIPR